MFSLNGVCCKVRPVTGTNGSAKVTVQVGSEPAPKLMPAAVWDHPRMDLYWVHRDGAVR